MNPQEPVIPDPDAPQQDPVAEVDDPPAPGSPDSYQAGSDKNEGLDAYDEAEAESFPASDPPAASEPGA